MSTHQNYSHWTDLRGIQQTTHIHISDNPANPTLPLILLLHGMGGDIHHMSAPANSPGMNFDLGFRPPDVIDRGWHAYPNWGYWSVFFSPTKNVTGWQSVLAEAGYLTVNYAQVDPWGNLAQPVLELEGVVRKLLFTYNKRIAFVCHSRGGLLLRLFLQRMRNEMRMCFVGSSCRRS